VTVEAGERSPLELRRRVAELLSTEGGPPETAYEKATADAAAAVATYLSSHPEELVGDRSRHSDAADGLYVRVQRESGDLEALRLSSLMWTRAVDAALAALDRTQ
jgi:hypothetical protein